MAGYGLTIIGALFIGRLGPEQLSVSVLASSIYNVAGLSVALGLSSGMETLCGQAFGAGDYKTLGLVLQRAVLVCWTFCIPVVALLMDAGPLLAHAGQDAAIAGQAALYLRLLLPCLFASTAAECMRKYLLAQQVVRPTMVRGTERGGRRRRPPLLPLLAVVLRLHACMHACMWHCRRETAVLCAAK